MVIVGPLVATAYALLMTWAQWIQFNVSIVFPGQWIAFGAFWILVICYWAAFASESNRAAPRTTATDLGYRTIWRSSIFIGIACLFQGVVMGVYFLAFNSFIPGSPPEALEFLRAALPKGVFIPLGIVIAEAALLIVLYNYNGTANRSTAIQEIDRSQRLDGRRALETQTKRLMSVATDSQKNRILNLVARMSALPLRLNPDQAAVCQDLGGQIANALNSGEPLSDAALDRLERTAYALG